VVHFSAVLFVCIFVVIPSETLLSLAALPALGSVTGLIYSARIWVQLFVRRSFDVDVVDRLFYALIPLAGDLLALASAVVLFMQYPWSLELLAAALITLLLSGIRNAWDMTIWIVIRTPVPDADRPPLAAQA